MDDHSLVELLLNFITTDNDFQNPSEPRVRKRDKIKGASTEFKHVALDPRTQYMQRKAKEQLNTLDAYFSQRNVINQFQKFWYTMTMLDIFFCGIIVAHRPQYLHLLYTLELVILLPIRFVMYRKKNFQFYLADLCYFVNFLLLLYIWVWPEWTPLWISCFGFSFGTLAVSIALWRNSLVMQSIDKTTSTFIHIFPPLVCYTINFRLDEKYKLERFSGALRAEKWQTVNSILWITALYFVWQSLYHYFITVRQAEKIKNGTVTSFEYMRKKYAKSWIGRIVNSLPGSLPVLAFTMIQLLFQLVTMLPCPLYYQYESLCATFLVTLFSIASYNGATYYIDVYGNRFRSKVEELKAELELEHADEQNSNTN